MMWFCIAVGVYLVIGLTAVAAAYFAPLRDDFDWQDVEQIVREQSRDCSREESTWDADL